MVKGTNWQKIVTSTLGSPADLCNVEFLINGRKAFESIVKAIRTADRFIKILGWMLDIDFELIPGQPDTTLLALLTKAISMGVYVDVLIWENPNYPNTSQTLDRLRIELGKYQKLHPNYKRLSLTNNFDVKTDNQSPSPAFNIVPPLRKTTLDLIGKILWAGAFLQTPYRHKCKEILNIISKTNSVGSHHEKIIIVGGREGLIGFCGGIDINSNRLHRNNGVYDLHCRVKQGGAERLVDQSTLRQINYDPIVGSMKPSYGGFTSQKVDSSLDYAYTKIVHTYNLKSDRNPIKNRSMWKIIQAIIQSAKTYIYIEDQYLVSNEIAKFLNAKLQDQNFQKLVILTQDARITTELLFPNEKRGEFIATLYKGLPPSIKSKATIFITDLDKRHQQSISPQSYVHAKLYLIDDELAIVGSANCSARSLTLDSETGAVIFDADKPIVKNFRKALWWDRTKDSKQFSQDFDPIKASQCFDTAARRADSKISYYAPKGYDLDQEILNNLKLRTISTQPNNILSAVSGIISATSLSTLISKMPLLKGLIWDNFVDPDNGY